MRQAATLNFSNNFLPQRWLRWGAPRGCRFSSLYVWKKGGKEWGCRVLREKYEAFFFFIQSLCNSVKPVYPQKIDNISLHLSLALSTLLSLPPLPPSAFLCTPPWWVQFLTRPHIQLVAKWIIHACSRSTVRQRGRKREKREGEAKTAYERCYVYVCVCMCASRSVWCWCLIWKGQSCHGALDLVYIHPALEEMSAQSHVRWFSSILYSPST